VRAQPGDAVHRPRKSHRPTTRLIFDQLAKQQAEDEASITPEISNMLGEWAKISTLDVHRELAGINSLTIRPSLQSNQRVRPVVGNGVWLKDSHEVIKSLIADDIPSNIYVHFIFRDVNAPGEIATCIPVLASELTTLPGLMAELQSDFPESTGPELFRNRQPQVWQFHSQLGMASSAISESATQKRYLVSCRSADANAAYERLHVFLVKQSRREAKEAHFTALCRSEKARKERKSVAEYTVRDAPRSSLFSLFQVAPTSLDTSRCTSRPDVWSPKWALDNLLTGYVLPKPAVSSLLTVIW
jgi:hypothetical protein